MGSKRGFDVSSRRYVHICTYFALVNTLKHIIIKENGTIKTDHHTSRHYVFFLQNKKVDFMFLHVYIVNLLFWINVSKIIPLFGHDSLKKL